MIHFNGLTNVSNPGVLAFPKVSVCLDCGFSVFTVQETELTVLSEDTRWRVLKANFAGRSYIGSSRRCRSPKIRWTNSNRRQEAFR
jgi:hypothetical protein